MNPQEILQKFESINTWKQNGQRAPHKPLLILLALGEIQRGNLSFIPYSIIEAKLKELLIDFGPPRKTIYTTFPFIRLANDDLWEFNKPELINSKKDYSKRELLDNDLQGKLPDEVTEQFQKNPLLIRQVAEAILEENFPHTIHEDILAAVGLDIALSPIEFNFRKVRKRDPIFRELILKAYGYRCAVCGFSVRLRNKLLALEAAHIKWHQAGGPDVEVNGIALCATHHKLFDLGAFAIDNNLKCWFLMK